ncbi:LuxR family transcriptional regulator (plasmid) [Burkholderia sp. FERM BP-3421]|uniref:LuxR family transcriptional regulator n=1 Tax=Burkholderia sp. FERM BP-3421 TaxID=1494466 RepID=UPI0023609ADE|nr:LuxR family transcriptional regulator [Burkholderia sp. FERM BP-3421]WDD90760.1 LuxR family transcriptional regulator [Burkholderia sp. FERM BP-3421]
MYEDLSVESFNEILHVHSERGLFDHTQSRIRQLGFKNFVYRYQLAGASTSRRAFDGYPPAWSARYEDAGYAEIDPLIRQCLSRTVPLIWDDALFTGPAARLRAEAKAHGLVYGLSCPVHDRGGMFSMLCMATDFPFQHRQDNTLRLLSLAQLLASFVHSAMRKLLECKAPAQNTCDLTTREREALQWAGRGKTAWEISKILGITQRTVVFHLTNAVRKMGATNRAQAVAMASARGVI